MYLLVIKYASEAERKRIEYLLEKWKKNIKMERIRDIVVVVKKGEPTEMLEELYGRVSKNNVEIFSIEKVSPDIEKNRREIELYLEESYEHVEKLLSFIMAKQKATLKRSFGGFRVYERYTKKGMVEISIKLEKIKNGVKIAIAIEGYGDAVDLVYERLNEEISYFKTEGDKNV